MQNRVRVLLIATLVIMCLPAVIGSYFVIGDVLASQSAIYNSNELRTQLEKSQENLKILSDFNPVSEKNYRKQFDNIQDLKLIYESDGFFDNRLRSSLKRYFMYLIGGLLLLALILSLIITVFIDRYYRNIYLSLIKEKEKSSYLEEMGRWQEMAKKMAHEVRRPIMPIQTWLSNINSAFRNKSPSFDSVLGEGTGAIYSELKTLNSMVTEFSKFAKLPEASLEPVDLPEFLERFCADYSEIWPEVKFEIVYKSSVKRNFKRMIDESHFRNILVNMTENAIQANIDTSITIRLTLEVQEDQWSLSVFNSGLEIDDSERNQIFEIYYSTRSEADNMGLGLAIVRFLLIEQGLFIVNLPASGGALFKISSKEDNFDV